MSEKTKSIDIYPQSQCCGPDKVINKIYNSKKKLVILSKNLSVVETYFSIFKLFLIMQICFLEINWKVLYFSKAVIPQVIKRKIQENWEI